MSLYSLFSDNGPLKKLSTVDWNSIEGGAQGSVVSITSSSTNITVSQPQGNVQLTLNTDLDLATCSVKDTLTVYESVLPDPSKGTANYVIATDGANYQWQDPSTGTINEITSTGSTIVITPNGSEIVDLAVNPKLTVDVLQATGGLVNFNSAIPDPNGATNTFVLGTDGTNFQWQSAGVTEISNDTNAGIVNDSNIVASADSGTVLLNLNPNVVLTGSVTVPSINIGTIGLNNFYTLPTLAEASAKATGDVLTLTLTAGVPTVSFETPTAPSTDPTGTDGQILVDANNKISFDDNADALLVNNVNLKMTNVSSNLQGVAYISNGDSNDGTQLATSIDIYPNYDSVANVWGGELYLSNDGVLLTSNSGANTLTLDNDCVLTLASTTILPAPVNPKIICGNLGYETAGNPATPLNLGAVSTPQTSTTELIVSDTINEYKMPDAYTTYNSALVGGVLALGDQSGTGTLLDPFVREIGWQSVVNALQQKTDNETIQLNHTSGDIQINVNDDLVLGTAITVPSVQVGDKSGTNTYYSLPSFADASASLSGNVLTVDNSSGHPITLFAPIPIPSLAGYLIPQYGVGKTCRFVGVGGNGSENIYLEFGTSSCLFNGLTLDPTFTSPIVRNYVFNTGANIPVTNPTNTNGFIVIPPNATTPYTCRRMKIDNACDFYTDFPSAYKCSKPTKLCSFTVRAQLIPSQALDTENIYYHGELVLGGYIWDAGTGTGSFDGAMMYLNFYEAYSTSTVEARMLDIFPLMTGAGAGTYPMYYYIGSSFMYDETNLYPPAPPPPATGANFMTYDLRGSY